MNLYVGTSGYSYKEWKGRFYPADWPAAKMLEYYGGHFRAVEVNNTFYRLPEAPVFENWTKQVPTHFKFAVKAPQLITHRLQLKEAGDALATLLERAGGLGNRLGPLLFQLPPFLKKDAQRLRQFLALRPAASRWSFEFRHASWFDDEIHDLLAKHKTALCIADAEGDLEIPFVATTDWGYLRLRRDNYDSVDLKKWVARVLKQKWEDAFIFFKHEDEAKGPDAARRLLELASKRLNEPKEKTD